MTIEQFLDALDTHGPDLAAWPPPLRLAGASIAATSAATAALLAAAEVEHLLTMTRVERLGNGAVAARAMGGSQIRHRQTDARWWAIGAAAAMVLGVASGSAAALADGGSSVFGVAFGAGGSDAD